VVCDQGDATYLRLGLGVPDNRHYGGVFGDCEVDVWLGWMLLCVDVVVGDKRYGLGGGCWATEGGRGLQVF
jgi:hypothetical protein